MSERRPATRKTPVLCIPLPLINHCAVHLGPGPGASFVAYLQSQGTMSICSIGAIERRRKIVASTSTCYERYVARAVRMVAKQAGDRSRCSATASAVRWRLVYGASRGAHQRTWSF